MSGKRWRTGLTAAVGAGMLAAGSGPAWAQLLDNEWLGANSDPNPANTSLDVNDPLNWSLGAVPDATHRAIFNFNDGNNDGNQLFIDAATTAFNPGGLVITGAGFPLSGGEDVFLDKSLTMEGIKLTFGGTSGSFYSNRLNVGTQTPGENSIVLTLTGATPLDLTDGGQSWEVISVDESTVFDLSGSNITINAPSPHDNAGGGGIAGGTRIENATLTANAEMNFTAVAGTINLGAAGSNPSGTLGLRFVQMAVRSDQTWNAAPEAYLEFSMRAQGDASQRPSIIESIDAGRLDNLGEVNIALGRSGGDHTAMNLLGGTYGSLAGRGGSTSHRNAYVYLSGDVNLVGHTVAPPTGEVEATASEYSLEINNGNGNNMSNWRVITGGHDLTLANSLLLRDGRSGGTAGHHQINARLVADGSTVNIGGDVVIFSVNMGPDAPASGFIVNDNIGITGDTSTVINLAGDWNHQAGYVDGAGLSESTLSMVGGGSMQTFEVGDAVDTMDVQDDSHALGTFNIGDGLDTAVVELVNNHLNNNAVTLTGELATDRDGEKLIAGNLNINLGSTLDVNGLAVLIATALDINGGLLDLNTGDSLTVGDRVEDFIGLGDQTASWNLANLTGTVMDSSNQLAQFTAVHDAGLDQTFWEVSQVIPEPASLALLGLGGLALLGRRGRRPRA